MSDDYLGRLVARYAPVRHALPGAPGVGTGSARRTLVQPRLPGPFERIESLGGAPAEPHAPAARNPYAPLTAPSEQLRVEREIRTTERETTVLRPEATRPDAVVPAERPVRPTAPLLRPAARPEPGPRPAAPEGQRLGTRRAGGRPEEPGAPRPAATPLRPDTDAAPRAVAPALRPRTEVPTARDTARAAAGRRGQRPAERVVHVQIGRLEVSAAGPDRPATGARAGRADRRGPALSLADYLARGERTS
ncbi:hypothetical protein [Streptomyces ochraceiscleroticus]|uniref:Uncharacterized protein n=1 Tax=Streptomyces ochraceiscleroticus TaxID=47761 RepID=A0ABW1MFT6_9ACTN|nr:hypothetical protein [Streptomyces ochraceiscleroticus]